jgi:hypothetical protein
LGSFFKKETSSLPPASEIAHCAESMPVLLVMTPFKKARAPRTRAFVVCHRTTMRTPVKGVDRKKTYRVEDEKSEEGTNHWHQNAITPVNNG